MKLIRFDLDTSLYNYLVFLSRETGITISDLMRTALEQIYGKKKVAGNPAKFKK